AVRAVARAPASGARRRVAAGPPAGPVRPRAAMPIAPPRADDPAASPPPRGPTVRRALRAPGAVRPRPVVSVARPGRPSAVTTRAPHVARPVRPADAGGPRADRSPDSTPGHRRLRIGDRAVFRHTRGVADSP